MDLSNNAAVQLVLGCVLIVIGGPLLCKSFFDDWPGVDAGGPFEHGRLMICLTALLLVIGATLLLVSGEHGPGWVVLITVLVPVVLVLSPSLLGADESMIVAFYSCLLLMPVAAAMALRTIAMPRTPVTARALLVFAVVAIAGSFLAAALLKLVVSFAPTGEGHLRATASVVAVLAGAALASVPVQLLYTGHQSAAIFTIPFALVAPFAILDSQTLLPLLFYVTTGPVALGAAVYRLFADR